MNPNGDLRKKILEENIKVQRLEAEVFDERHPEIFNRFQQKEIINDIKFIRRQISAKNPSALDIGAGTGNLSLKFLKYGFSVTAVDISKEMLDVLRKKNVTGQIRLVESDVDSFILKEDRKYDVVAFSTMLHHVPNYIETIKNVIQLLNEGGILYIVHEPAKKKCSKSVFSFFWRTIGKLDNVLSFIRAHLKGISIPSIDYTYADYHENLNSDLIIKILKENDLEVLIYKEYIAFKSRIFSTISNKLLSNRLKIYAGQLRCFKLIAKKTILKSRKG